MAITLERQFSINISALVESSIDNVRIAKRQESARVESEFQKAVAEGTMSYEAQLAFREEQLADERVSSFSEETTITSLETSIGSLKKLARFERIRNKYKDSLDAYIGGRESISSHIKLLEDTIETENDSAMREQLRDLLSEARKTQITIETNAVKNRASLAQKDRSVSLIDSSVREVTDKQAKAAIVGNEDEAAAWGETLIALKSSKAKLQIEDAANEMSFRINRYNLKSTDKLGMLNDEISKSDVSTPIVFNGVQYTSQKAFWEDKRNEYIRTSYFEEVGKELDEDTARIRASNKFGQIPIARVDAVNAFYNGLKQRAEFAPFAELTEQYRIGKVNTYATDLADSVQREFDASEQGAADVRRAEQAVADLEGKFGIKVSRLPFVSIGAEKTIAETVSAETKAQAPKPGEPTAPAAGAGKIRTVVTGDTLSRIATEAGVSLKEILNLNPQFQANPNLIRPGQQVTLPQPPVAPAAAPAPVTPPAQPKPPVTPTTPPTTPPKPPAPPVTPAPQAPAAPTPTTPKTYVVKSGDTLTAVAQRELGDASRWRELKTEGGQTYDEESAKKLQIGTKLVIPQ